VCVCVCVEGEGGEPPPSPTPKVTNRVGCVDWTQNDGLGQSDFMRGLRHAPRNHGAAARRGCKSKKMIDRFCGSFKAKNCQ
jgi:hypothetical protein